MSAPIDPIPQSDPLVDRAGKMGERWYRWLSTVLLRIVQSPTVLTTTQRSSLTSALGPVTLLTPTQPGLYRVSWALQETQAASGTSSVSVVIGWTAANGVAQSETALALTGNTPGTHASGQILLNPLPAQPITLATTYSSSGGTAMAYTVGALVEALT